MNVIIFLIILLVLVLVHEWGHFFTAKKFGIRVDEFGFGFPPKLFGKKIGETEYSVNALPFGGFVKIFGENPDEENTNGPDSARSFVNKPKWQQAIILFAGVFMNLVLAWVLFSAGFMSGLPTAVDSAPKGAEIRDANLTVMSVLPNTPAERAGLASMDRVVLLTSGADVLEAPAITPDTLKNFVVNHKEISVGYLRGETNEFHTTTLTPEKADGGDPTIGISMATVGTLKLPFFQALYAGAKFTINVAVTTAVGFYKLIAGALTGQGSFSNLSGPVGIVGLVGEAYSFGIVYLLSLSALISVNLAVLNLIPFPALDGGRLLFLLIEKIKGSRIKAQTANIANMAGFAILILLMVAVTYNDIIRLVAKG